MKRVRTCPCGLRFSQETLYGHLMEEHEGDVSFLAHHLAELMRRALNRRLPAKRRSERKKRANEPGFINS